jgi:excisionase family DNA binding protein
MLSYMTDRLFRSPPSIITPLMTMKDACAYLQCTAKYLERAVKAGRLNGLKPSRKFLRFRQADLDVFLESGATGGKEQ